jgi:hypothetical protein
MTQPHPDTEELDAFLREVVATLQSAAAQGLRHARDDSAVTDRAIRDCTEILEQIMEGDVDAWLRG